MTEEQVVKGDSIIAKIKELKSRCFALDLLSNGAEGSVSLSGFKMEVEVIYDGFDDSHQPRKLKTSTIISNGMMESKVVSIRNKMLPDIEDEITECARRINKIFNKEIKLLEKELKEL